MYRHKQAKPVEVITMSRIRQTSMKHAKQSMGVCLSNPSIVGHTWKKGFLIYFVANQSGSAVCFSALTSIYPHDVQVLFHQLRSEQDFLNFFIYYGFPYVTALAASILPG